MIRILFVGVGGFIGSALRYVVSGYVQQWTKSVGFPYGTLSVNVIGCLMIGFLSHLVEAHGMFSAETRALVLIGILGGFTTFSTFGNETMNLWRDGETFPGLANIAAHIVFGLGAVWAGRALAFLMWR